MVIVSSSGAEVVEQTADVDQRGGREPVVPFAPPIGRGDEARLAQDAEVAADGRSRDGVGGRQVDDARRPGDELAEQVPPDRVGQRVEHVHTEYGN